MIGFLVERFVQHQDREAVLWNGRSYDYRWLNDRIQAWLGYLRQHAVTRGTVAIVEADFSPDAVALLLALIEHRCIIVPLSPGAERKKQQYGELARGEVRIRLTGDVPPVIDWLPRQTDHPLYAQLRQAEHPGLVLFSSGSTGNSKAAVHDWHLLLEKYKKPRRNLRTLAFLLFDHIGGIDTLFYSLSNASCIITVSDRSPDSICLAIEAYRIEVLPVSPTFLNLLLLSEAYTRYDLSSLKYITYGTEVMPERTLKRIAELMPHAALLQKYGTTEIGTLRSKSKSSDSLWVSIGGDGYELRVVDGVLQVKARSAMLGYLNAPSPFTDDGWFITGDLVEVDGEYMRIKGRSSDIINVGGEKVYPAEVENVILELEGVAEVTVYGVDSPIVGQMVCARVRRTEAAEASPDERDFAKRVKKHCSERLQSYKVPVRIAFTYEELHSQRFKKIRRIAEHE
ncbi:ANL family adenylate-forming protein [Paenibacillus harenae]|uniref:ANL family adenylate-forming protein n=1 Tax=Paenibacillus harenae TaxID=306543 RepID=UPI00040963D2|nr:fatty acid--CoA ligase family protein [Paenibacillus harenae]